MSTTVTTVGTVLVVQPAGKIDSGNAKAFEAELLGHLEGAGKLVVDFGALDFVSSAGLRVLLMAAKRAKASGKGLALCALNGSIREVFEVSGFVQLFAIHPGRDEAVAALG